MALLELNTQRAMRVFYILLAGAVLALTIGSAFGCSTHQAGTGPRKGAMSAASHPADLKKIGELYEAAKHGDIAEAQAILAGGVAIDSDPLDGNTPMMAACRAGKVEMVKFLIRRGANVNWENVWGETPLGCAAEADSVELIRLLVASGARIEGKKGGRSPLVMAVDRKTLNALKALVAAHANPNAKDDGADKTPALLLAVIRNSLPCVEILVRAGAKSSLADVHGETPLALAKKKHEWLIAKALQSAGATR